MVIIQIRWIKFDDWVFTTEKVHSSFSVKAFEELSFLSFFLIICFKFPPKFLPLFENWEKWTNNSILHFIHTFACLLTERLKPKKNSPFSICIFDLYLIFIFICKVSDLCQSGIFVFPHLPSISMEEAAIWMNSSEINLVLEPFSCHFVIFVEIQRLFFLLLYFPSLDIKMSDFFSFFLNIFQDKKFL